MSRPLLYTYRRCPYAMRARMALLLAGIDFDAFEISLKNKPAEMLAASPKGTVPVLCLSEGLVLEQSWEIVRWAFSQGMCPDGWERAQTPANRELLAINDGAFKHHLDRYKYPERFEDTQINTGPKHRHLAMTVMLEPLEARLSSSRFLGGDEACATDIGIFPFIRQYAAVDPAWFADLSLPQVKAWMSYWLSHPVFDGCMQKLPPQERVLFPSTRFSTQQGQELDRGIPGP